MLIYLMKMNPDIKDIVEKYNLKTGRLKGKRVAVEVHGDELGDKIRDAAGSDLFAVDFGGAINDKKC